MDEQTLIDQFKKAYPKISYSALHKIAEGGKIITILKKQFFIRQNSIDKRLAFVISSLFRGFTNYDGEEKSLWFSNEYDIVASYKGILLNQPAQVTCQALEDSTLFVIPYEQLKELAKNDNEIANTIITMLEQLMVESFQRTERFTLLDAETRYLNLLDNKPEIIKRVSQKLLATYIGITPVSLSRLRSRLNQG